MATRVTKADVEGHFATYCREVGWSIGTKRGEVWLDFAPQYGGWRVHQAVNDHGGYGTPFGAARSPGGKFFALLDFALATLRIARRAEEGEDSRR